MQIHLLPMDARPIDGLCPSCLLPAVIEVVFYGGVNSLPGPDGYLEYRAHFCGECEQLTGEPL